MGDGFHEEVIAIDSPEWRGVAPELVVRAARAMPNLSVVFVADEIVM